MRDYQSQLGSILPTALTGRVVGTEGLLTIVAGFPAPVGATVEIQRDVGEPIPGEVIGFRNDQTLIHLLGEMSGLRHGNKVRLIHTYRSILVGDGLLGRVVDSHGNVIDGRPAPPLTERVRMEAEPPRATDRPQIDEPLSTGIRAIDGLLTCGRGQRMGIFSGSGVGKSVLLGMMARYTSADINVIGLVGERGREVNEFIQRDLGVEGLRRSVVVVATSDAPALMRVQAAMTATAIAEHFRDRGKNVLLMMDSLTRFAMAQREIGLAAGEPPTTRGYPPSVFALLPKLVERAGRARRGSITAFYSVLVEGDDTNEPVSDTVRGLIDGHTVLSRKIATRGHFPAIDVLESISRLMTEIVTPQHLLAARKIRELLGIYHDHEDLISIGAYRQGTNPRLDLAIAMRDKINAYLQQTVEVPSSHEQARDGLMLLADQMVAAATPQPPPNTPVAATRT